MNCIARDSNFFGSFSGPVSNSGTSSRRLEKCKPISDGVNCLAPVLFDCNERGPNLGLSKKETCLRGRVAVWASGQN